MQDAIPVVSYERASADRAKDEHSVKDQRKVNLETAKRQGWRVVASFTDNEKSAAKDGVVRDEFEAMLKVLRAGKLADGTAVMGVVVVADDRLVRRAGDYERFIDAFTLHENRVYADAKMTKNLYSEDVESMGLMAAVFSRIEVKKIRRRVTRWHRSRAEKGAPPNGMRAFGWQADKVRLDPAESAAVRKAVDEVIAGRSMNSIVLEWQKRGFLTVRGNEWTSTAFKTLLRNPRLCGWRKLNGEIVCDEHGNPVVGQWEPIITPDQWSAVQAIFKGRKGKQIAGTQVFGDLPQDYREPRYLLSGIARCGKPRDDGTLCMSPLRANMRPGVGHYYQCRSKSEGGCGGVGRRGDLVDLFVSEALLAKLEERSLTTREVGPWAGEEELADYKQQLTELRQHWSARQISNSLFFLEARRLEAEIARLTTERERHSATVLRAQSDVVDIRRRWYAKEGDDGALDISQKRAYLREAFHAVIVHPVAKGNAGRSRFNPDRLEPIWRED